MSCVSSYGRLSIVFPAMTSNETTIRLFNCIDSGIIKSTFSFNSWPAFITNGLNTPSGREAPDSPMLRKLMSSSFGGDTETLAITSNESSTAFPIFLTVIFTEVDSPTPTVDSAVLLMSDGILTAAVMVSNSMELSELMESSNPSLFTTLNESV